MLEIHKRPIRVYLDTSVFGGCFDQEFAEDSNRIFSLIRNGQLHLMLSDIVLTELEDAPPYIKNLPDTIPDDVMQICYVDREIIKLQEAYLEARIVGIKHEADAMHVACATVNHADAIISWNFKHIVRLDKIQLYNYVNMIHNYHHINILTPQGVRYHE